MVVICTTEYLMEKTGFPEFISLCYPHFLGVWVLVRWHYYWIVEVTIKAFVMIYLLPPCESAHICWRFGQIRDINKVRMLFFPLPRGVAFLVLVYFGLYIIVRLFGEVHLLGIDEVVSWKEE